ncbi:MAG: TetR/AcrR family transcriptional regulator [Clostridia bacterium]
MKRSEKAEFSRAKIIHAATDEFSNKSYDTASLNNICNQNGISKGLIYHYFGNKDDLYLSCVRECFCKFTLFLADEDYDFSDFQYGMNQYLARRLLFFRTYPQDTRLFFYTVLQPPKHLEPQIHELKAAFDAQCRGYYTAALEHIPLRDGVSKERALRYFVLFQELFNGYFKQYINDDSDLSELVHTHEVQLSSILNLMLYGITKEN